jgi:hypothetical protein
MTKQRLLTCKHPPEHIEASGWCNLCGAMWDTTTCTWKVPAALADKSAECERLLGEVAEYKSAYARAALSPRHSAERT